MKFIVKECSEIRHDLDESLKILETSESKIVKNHTISASKTMSLNKPKATLDRPRAWVKNINELKKVTPRVKLFMPEVTNILELTRKSVRNIGEIKRTKNETKRENLQNYCRTCAGLKVPLIDIFSERGTQMRLAQQLKHLEDIKQHDNLSTQMCMDCICDLKMSYKFFMQIKKAQVKLSSMNSSLQMNSGNFQRPTISEDDDKSRATSTITLTKNPEKTNCEAKKSESKKIDELTNISSPPRINYDDGGAKGKDDARIDDGPQIKIEPETSEDYSLHYSDDNESIEEFDPDDPSFRSDVNDTKDLSQEENTQRLNNLDTTIKTQHVEHVEDKSGILTETLSKIEQSCDPNKNVYQYDAKLKAYVKVEPSEENESENITGTTSEKSSHDRTKETIKQPNILKRKASGNQNFLEKPVTRVGGSETTLVRTGKPKLLQTKKPKLDVQNALNITNENENGIMYVTVKGTKPNELLLVKVRKMDKQAEKNEERKKSLKMETIEIDEKLKKLETTISTKDKEISEERARAIDKREQIIEEQIEEYKKKREKILGGTSSIPNALKFEDGMIRFVNPTELSENKKSDEKEITKDVSQEESAEIRHVAIKEKKIEEQSKVKTRIEDDDKSCISTCDYLTRLARLKKKWENAKRKKENLQRNIGKNTKLDNMKKLYRMLGKRDNNLVGLQDYLKQRKIVVRHLKNEDVATLSEDCNGSTTTKNLPDLIDESPPDDYIHLVNYLDCDYCPETFARREVLEEHLKTHDYKLMYWCDDCRTEFPTIKSKRVHNVTCVKKFICRYCNAVLDSKGKKRQHEQKHVDSMHGQLCEVCGEKFKHQATLDQHFKTQHMTWEKIYQCPKCPKKFAFKQKLTFHLKSVHTTLRAYLCEDCGADFKNPASLRHHRVRKHHPTSNKRACPVCNKIVPFYSLSKHMYTHKAYTIHCPHCDKMFKNTSTLKQHVRIHEDQRQYRCDTCGVGFNRRDGLRLHMRVHQKTDSRALKECSCQICSEKFPNHSMLVIHRNRVHKDGRQYTCHICNRSMLSTRSLEWHMSHIHNEAIPETGKVESITQTENKRVSCVHCDKTFKTEMILRTHIKNTHIEKDPTKCLDCEQTFTSDVRLRHHMMIAHNRLEGTLTCPHCPKRFVNQLRLKTHMISHSEDRPYTCEKCGFNLKTKIQLIKHHQNRHSDERPLQCRYCPWRCKQVSALVCHERTHTNERPYSCIVCRQRFKYLGDKNKHERRHESLGGSGFKRIVAGRNLKNPKVRTDETSNSEHEHVDYDVNEDEEEDEESEEQERLNKEDQEYEEQPDEEYVDGEDIVKFESQGIREVYEQNYEQEYEETSREASEAAEVIMNMEDTTVYTEEVTADNIEEAEIITDEIITSDILNTQPDMTVVHLQQQDESGKIQVIPVMLSLPDLNDSSTEVNLATASIMYNN